MALIPIDNVGQVGIVKDINPWQLPPNVWSDGNNVRAEHGAIVKSPGYAEVMATCPIVPLYITNLNTAADNYWIIGGTAAIHVFKDSNDTWYDITRSSGAYSATAEENWTSTVLGGVLIMTNGFDDPQYWALTDGEPSTSTLMADLSDWPSLTILDGAITSTTSTANITVDDTSTFPTSGTFTIDSEDILYTGKTSTTFTGIARSQNGTTGATHLDNAPVFVSTECNSMRSFRSFLVALNVTKAGTGFPRLVKWSTEAATQTVPSSWDETSATVDAGEYELADTRGAILDGLPLRDTFMIYKEDSIYSMSYVGTPFIFSFRQLSPSVGVLTKNCVAEFDGGHFFFGNGDIYINDGQKVTSILPHKIRDYVFDFIDGAQYKKSFVVADYGNTEMWACFPTAENTSNQCNKAVVWNWTNQAFTLRDLPNLSHIGYGSIDDPNSFTTWAAATGITWSAALGAWSATWSTVENVLVMASLTDTKIYRNASGNQEDTTDMTSYIERTGMAMGAQGNEDRTSVKRIKAIWPRMEVSGANTVNVYVGTQMSTEEGVTWTSAYTFNPDSQSKVSCRASGKLYGVKFESTGDFYWRLDGYDIEVEDAGRRGSRSY